MNIALDSTGIRIRPFPKASGFCQVCQESLIPHCGDINAWHWQHRYDRNCDPWKEHETEWHRSWKAKFPIEWQEVIRENDLGEKHIADVRTKKGIVIEFQNSSISTHTIREREEFYEDMIWVVNASGFKDNFRMSSAVKQELRLIEKEYAHSRDSVKRKLILEIDELKAELKTIDEAKEEKLSAVKAAQNDLDDFREFQAEPEKTVSRILTYWNNVTFYDRQINKILDKLGPESKQQFLSCESLKKEKAEAHTKLEASLTAIQKKPDILFQNRTLKIIQYHEINAASYAKFAVIDKNSVRSLFTEGAFVKSELEFNNLPYRLNEVILAVDLTEAIERLQLQISHAKQEFDQAVQQYNSLVEGLTNLVAQTVTENIPLLEQKVDSLDDAFAELAKKSDDQMHAIYRLESAFDDSLAAARQEIEKEKADDRSSAMYTFKGVYYFDWKHERPTWRFADMPVYFDMGDGFIFRRVRQNEFHKQTYEEFLRDYRGAISTQPLMTSGK